MKLHRLYVGLKDDKGTEYNVSDVSRITSRYLKSFTIIPCQGYEYSVPEPSCIIEVILDDDYIWVSKYEALRSIQRDIKAELNQREVLHIGINIDE